MVDLALFFAELARAPGVTQADLGRRYRKSAGYVSILCRLGRALEGLPPLQRDALRVPHVTLKAAQGLVSRYPDAAALRAAASRLAASPPPTRRRARAGSPGQWDRPPAGPDVIDPLPEPPAARSRQDAFVYTWDADAARRDPAAALARFEAFVRETTDEVIARLRRTAGDVGPASTRPDPSRAGRGSSPIPAGFDELSLRQLHERVGATLRGHRARMQEFLAERGRARGRTPAPGGALDDAAPAADDADAEREDLERDLA